MEQLLQYLKAASAQALQRLGIGAEEAFLEFVADDTPGTIQIRCCKSRLPASAADNQLVYVGGKLYRNRAGSGFVHLTRLREVCRTSLVPVIRPEDSLVFVKLDIQGPPVLSYGTHQYLAVATYLLGNSTVQVPSPAEFTSVRKFIYKSGLYTTPRTTVAIKDTVACRMATPDGENHHASKEVLVQANLVRSPVRLTLLGPTEVKDNRTYQYVALLEYSDGSNETVAPQWSVSADWASVDAAGRVSIHSVATDSNFLLSARYESFTAEIRIRVTRTDRQPMRCRLGILRSSDLTQERFDSFAQVGPSGSLNFTFHTNTGQGSRAWLIVPLEMGVPEVKDSATGDYSQWETPAIATFKVQGTDTHWYVTHTKFDNLGNKEWTVT